MSKQRPASPPASPDNTISIIGPGMTVVGDCKTKGTIRIEGRVEGGVEAGKAVVVGKDGMVVGDISTQDAVISGRLKGTLKIGSRLELQSSCDVDGNIDTRRIVLEEGATVNGTVKMGSRGAKPPSTRE
ncbi:MAG: polymer-forming cytoskeletal protein [Gammaproteobacteria bacterium]|nr:polymer-forming cytoskeletal protein [Gammaproteobacteria bacterium]